jgi:hypothetical protein
MRSRWPGSSEGVASSVRGGNLLSCSAKERIELGGEVVSVGGQRGRSLDAGLERLRAAREARQLDIVVPRAERLEQQTHGEQRELPDSRRRTTESKETNLIRTEHLDIRKSVGLTNSCC